MKNELILALEESRDTRHPDREETQVGRMEDDPPRSVLQGSPCATSLELQGARREHGESEIEH